MAVVLTKMGVQAQSAVTDPESVFMKGRKVCSMLVSLLQPLMAPYGVLTLNRRDFLQSGLGFSPCFTAFWGSGDSML